MMRQAKDTPPKRMAAATTTLTRARFVSPVPIEPVYPMPEPGEQGNCVAQSHNLMLALNKNPSVDTDALRFVGFEIPGGVGGHIVVEDALTVYDQTRVIADHPDWTRITKASYWGAQPVVPADVVRLDWEQFKVLYEVLCIHREHNDSIDSGNEVLARMRAIRAHWGATDNVHETEDARFIRVTRRVVPPGTVLELI